MVRVKYHAKKTQSPVKADRPSKRVDADDATTSKSKKTDTLIFKGQEIQSP